ncbi:hypothetical protein BROUX41_003604 [Berkeleyomyces rouxiae]|uniref:uncharacterized protein n=1 Tax=Berkeleyomyces rouxiae TaxID=2035830 RepID=UPI003B78FC1B
MPAPADVTEIADLLVQLVGGASLCIFIGAHSSLARPPSAAPANQRRRRTASAAASSSSDSDSASDSDEYDPALQAGLDSSDAILLPLVSALVLYGMYCLITYLDNPDLLSRLVRGYISILSLVSVAGSMAQALQLATTLVFPQTWRTLSGAVYTVCPAQRGHALLTASGHGAVKRGVLGPLPWGVVDSDPASGESALSRGLWAVRAAMLQKWRVQIRVGRGVLVREQATFQLQHLAGVVLAVAVVAGYHFTNATALANTIAVCLCQMTFSILSPTTFVTGSLVLVGLFVYDIVMVFYTPLMVTVATKLDAPIKLVASSASRKSSMLGLGDIVVPGIVIAMALRFDLWRHYANKIKYDTVELKTTAPPALKSDASPGDSQTGVVVATHLRIMATKARYISVANKWGDWLWTLRLPGRSSHPGAAPLPVSLAGASFSKTYFAAAMAGYVAGLLAAMGCMLVFRHGQPALLYLVPAVLTAVWGTGLARGEIGLMLRYTEDGSLDTREVIAEVDAEGKPVVSEAEKARVERRRRRREERLKSFRASRDVVVLRVQEVVRKERAN